jgi:uncharacterized membrane protein (DUF485 family)
MSIQPSSGDLTPILGSQTDVAPLGRDLPPPPHEAPAGGQAVDWTMISQQPEYLALLAAKKKFLVPATIFFVVYYFLLPISVGWAPDLMKTEIIGHANIAYVFGFSQFIMAWVLAAMYVKVSAGWDRQSAALLNRLGLH